MLGFALVGLAMSETGRLRQLSWRSKDYAQMTEKEFARVLQEITTVEELEAVANRRKHLQAPRLKRWSPWQKAAIRMRLWELRHG